MKQALTIFIISLPIIIFGQSNIYPESYKQQIIDTLYNISIYDDYRWLENINDKKTTEWIDQQNSYTKKVLKEAARKFNSSISINNYSNVRYDNPIKHGEYYFTYAYYNNIGSPALYYQNTMRDNPSVLVDPNFISSTDNISIRDISVS